MGFFSNEEFVRYKKCTQPVYQTPASVQQMLDISAIHENGIFEIERNNGSGNRKRKFDRVYSFSDLNYADQDRQRKDGICFSANLETLTNFEDHYCRMKKKVLIQSLHVIITK